MYTKGEWYQCTPLAYGDLFKVESGKRPVGKVLVEGDAGIGKTTLCIHWRKKQGDWGGGGGCSPPIYSEKGA